MRTTEQVFLCQAAMLASLLVERRILYSPLHWASPEQQYSTNCVFMLP